MTFGFWLKKFRERQQMSGRQFAKFLSIDGGNYNKYETDSLVAGADFIDRFSEAAKLNDVETALLRALASRHRIAEFIKREVPRPQTKGGSGES